MKAGGNFHVEGDPFGAWWDVGVFASVVQLCEGQDIAGLLSGAESGSLGGFF